MLKEIKIYLTHADTKKIKMNTNKLNPLLQEEGALSRITLY